jgi:hypothetical protein
VNRAALLVLIALALGGCQTTAEKSAQLEKAADAKEKAEAARGVHGKSGLTVTTESKRIKVLSTAVLSGKEGGAAVVTITNTSPTALRDIPISIAVRDSSGKTIYSNSAPGLSPSLVSVASLGPRGTLTWVDDQIQASGTPASVRARVGEGTPVTGSLPSIEVKNATQTEESAGEAGAEGTVANPSQVSQQELAVYAVARRGGKVVAAGRAVIPEVKRGASEHFQLFFVGSPKGAAVQFAAPPSAG